MSLNINLKVNPIVATLVLAAACILIFMLIRGCNNSQNLQLSNINYKEEIKRHKEDSIKNVQDKIAYNDSMEFLEGQWQLSKNKELSLNEDLGKANTRITNILNKHVPIKPSLDSSLTMVDNTFINECADCFDELTNGQQLVRKYKAEKDNQEHICAGKLRIKDKRIDSLDKFNAKLGASNVSLLSSIKEMEGKWQPRGRLYVSWGVLWKNYVPWAAGAGAMYQTKRNLIMGASWYYNSQGHMVQTNIHFPLSFKKR